MIAIVGCGNTNRSDDGAGPAVIAALKARRDLAPGIQLLDAGTDGIAVMFAARGCEALIVIDACEPHGQPGAIYEVPGSELEQSHEPALTLHDFRWDHALYSGRRMYGERFPRDVIVYLIEAESLDLGLQLSPLVAEAVSKLSERIAEKHLSAAFMTVRRGSLYLKRGDYERHFGGLEAVILLRDGTDLLILPVRHAAAGGYILKLKNSDGDRVVTAADFFRSNGIDDADGRELVAVWDDRRAALRAPAVFCEN